MNCRGSMGMWQGQGSVGMSAATTMVESFENKLIDQVHNQLHLYDVSLPLQIDKYACQYSWRESSTILEVDVETCKNKWKQVQDCSDKIVTSSSVAMSIVLNHANPEVLFTSLILCCALQWNPPVQVHRQVYVNNSVHDSAGCLHVVKKQVYLQPQGKNIRGRGVGGIVQ